ncbi:HupE/UreJ family protein [Aquabacterium sp.]|uniref:HupE/UreJ family protein n=1 Tax=Aquabacterium sp. TaxID=1872578 RepID=UPI003D6D9CAB
MTSVGKARPAFSGVFRNGLLVLWLAIGLALALAGRPAQAHPTPESRVWIDTTDEGLRLTLLMPLNRLEFAFKSDLTAEPDQVMRRHAQALADYVLAHVSMRSGDQLWLAQKPRLRVMGNDASADLQVVLELKAPKGADPRKGLFRYDAVTHEVMTHSVKVFLRSDWAGGMVSQVPRPLAELDSTHLEMPIDLPASSNAVSGLLSLLKDGVMHIVEGTDHLLFLLTLLLVSPLWASGGRWTGVRTAGAALRHTAAVVTAFTAGHTVALVLGSSGWLQLPSAMVELAVAATIAISALHAIRPILQRGDVAMAMAFGLVHGQAFSASLSGAGLLWQQHALALLAFNLGIELVQLVMVLVLLPLLWWFQSRFPIAGAWFRRGVGVLAFGAALWWGHDRLPPDCLSREGLVTILCSAALCVLPLWLCSRLAGAIKGDIWVAQLKGFAPTEPEPVELRQ